MKVVFALPGLEFSRQFFLNWLSFQSLLPKKGIEPIVSMEYVSNVSIVRERCLGLKESDLVKEVQFEPFYGQINYDYIMWIDSDTMFQPDDFFKLLELDLDIVGGLCKRDLLCYAAIKKEDKPFDELTFIREMDVKDAKDPIEVLHVGLAFTLVKKNVFERIPRPWFLTTVANFAGSNRVVSEDVYFCVKAREAGFRIWVDPRVKVKHLKTVCI